MSNPASTDQIPKEGGNARIERGRGNKASPIEGSRNPNPIAIARPVNEHDGIAWGASMDSGRTGVRGGSKNIDSARDPPAAGGGRRVAAVEGRRRGAALVAGAAPAAGGGGAEARGGAVVVAALLAERGRRGRRRRRRRRLASEDDLTEQCRPFHGAGPSSAAQIPAGSRRFAGIPTPIPPPPPRIFPNIFFLSPAVLRPACACLLPLRLLSSPPASLPLLFLFAVCFLCLAYFSLFSPLSLFSLTRFSLSLFFFPVTSLSLSCVIFFLGCSVSFATVSSLFGLVVACLLASVTIITFLVYDKMLREKDVGNIVNNY